MLDDVWVGQDRNPVVLATFRRFDTVHAEAAGKAGDTAKDGFEGFGEVVRDEVPDDHKHQTYIHE